LAKFYTFSIYSHHSEYLILTKNIPGTIISCKNTESDNDVLKQRAVVTFPYWQFPLQVQTHLKNVTPWPSQE
jgi:hypothetical protein